VFGSRPLSIGIRGWRFCMQNRFSGETQDSLATGTKCKGLSTGKDGSWIRPVSRAHVRASRRYSTRRLSRCGVDYLGAVIGDFHFSASPPPGRGCPAGRSNGSPALLVCLLAESPPLESCPPWLSRCDLQVQSWRWPRPRWLVSSHNMPAASELWVGSVNSVAATGTNYVPFGRHVT